MTEPAPPAYGVRRGDAARDRDTVLSLWRGNLGQDARMRAKYDWFYLQPAEAPLLLLLQHGAQDVGVCTAGRRRMLWRGHPIRAGVLVDLAVLPEHRSLGPAMILQQGMIDTARRELDLLYGFPNPKAATVFKRIGYRHLTDMVRYAKVLRHAPYLRRRMPAWIAASAGALVDLGAALRGLSMRWRNRGLRAAWQDRADARMDVLWAASARPDGLVAVRDHAHLAWRFDQAPSGSTRYLLLHDAGADVPLAWFATDVVDGVLHVRDFWSVDAADGIAPRLIAAFASAARAQGHVAVSIELATTPARLANWIASGFVERSRRPVFTSGVDGMGESPDLHLTSADEDE